MVFYMESDSTHHKKTALMRLRSLRNTAEILFALQAFHRKIIRHRFQMLPHRRKLVLVFTAFLIFALANFDVDT